MNDDLDAIRRVLAADVESFRRLVERYQRPLLTLIRNLTPPDTDHEGVAQEVFLAAFRSLASFDPKRSAFSTWLFTIPRNRCRNELARRRPGGEDMRRSTAGRREVKPSAYRDGQNVIRDGRNKGIVYMPPEAKDVPGLMHDLVAWIKDSEAQALPCPIRAGIAHYQFATIHPYYDGNGRTARLLTTLILHLSGYDLKGLYSLEEYYARNLLAGGVDQGFLLVADPAKKSRKYRLANEFRGSLS